MASDDNLRHISFALASQRQEVKGFTSLAWHIASMGCHDNGPYVLPLTLMLTERTAYRFNLDSQQPRLFVRCEATDEGPQPREMTASQDVAANWLDGDTQVLDAPMPLAIQAWLEAYLARHGERIEAGRKKKRAVAGRARQHQE
ncbi:DUF3305 domain-containing protein [Chromohalobacter israelensis]|uniref:DUF3305 domain-containing protein n=1 Tax=Chromohalobacter israelensis (strain ATCC BAA-138 / DSM 3043 / CIP 106854 / NCIMB 13768 / 1H11) TaxID=290398 RepID=Q1QW96_CHRI1|nr:DUF3305 domain-containing protein [Chromohalobacter salexigens]ABE59262.1 conserved hypothetical protein [Chromohalobacter salexigens DSM 3043]